MAFAIFAPFAFFTYETKVNEFLAKVSLPSFLFGYF